MKKTSGGVDVGGVERKFTPGTGPLAVWKGFVLDDSK